MAFAHEKYYGTIEFVDQGQNVARATVQLQGANIGAAATNLAAVVSAFVAVTDAWISSYTLHDQFTTDVAFTAALPHGEVSTKALILTQLSSSPLKKASLEVPAPKDAIFQAASGEDYNKVDGSNAAVTTLVALYEAASEAYISDGENVITGGFLKGKRVSRANTRI
jgi:hypothetical protein